MFERCVCPICQSPLQQADRALRCPSGHSYDIAREGYVNLLPAIGRKDAVHGDSPEMLQSRRSFLDRGHFGFLAESVSRLLSADPALHHEGVNSSAILDAGCGNGYYLSQLRNHFRQFNGCDNIEYYGVDLSKTAARMATRKDPQFNVVVANTRTRLPFASESMSVILNMFAPRNTSEFARILRPEGLLTAVIPQPGHLSELRERVNLLPIEADKEAHVLEQLGERFVLTGRHTLEHEFEIGGEELGALIGMSPNAWYVQDRGAVVLESGERITIGARFAVLQFRRLFT